MAYVIPSDTHGVGDSGHTTDHNNLADVLTAFDMSVRPVTPSGDGGGTTDVTNIQAALNTHATVRLASGGNFYLNAPLRVPSNTWLDAGEATVTLIANSGCNSVQSWAVQANTRCIDGVTTSSSHTFTSATANFQPSNVGNSIRIYYQDGTYLDTTISARASTTSITLTAAATANGTALYFYFGAGRDWNIKITGGSWVRQVSNYTSSTNGWDSNNIRIRHCDILEIGNIVATNYAGKYFISPGDCTAFYVHDIHGITHIDSDLVHVNGPASWGIIERITNTNPGDDTVSLTGSDFRNQEQWMADTMGNITGVSVRHVQVNLGFVTYPRAVLILAGQSGASNPYTVDQIDVRDIRSSLPNYPVYIGNDTQDSFTQGGSWGRILVDGVVNTAASPPGGAVAVRSPSTVTSLEVRSVIDVGASTSMWLESGATVTRLVIYGVDQGQIAISGTATNLFIINNPANLGVAGTFTAQQTFTGQVGTGAVITEDITVRPNAARSASASMFLDNTAGQIWEFFNSSGGQFGVYDDTNSKQPFYIDANINPVLHLAGGGAYVSSGVINVNTAGYGLQVKEGSNAKQGTAALSSGSVVVGNTSVTASSRIFLTSNADGGTPGWVRVSARSAGTSFTITSSSGTDTSTVAYQIFEPG